MEWSRPIQQGEIPSPRAGHASVTIGENWFIVGGGDNKSGMCLIPFFLVVENNVLLAQSSCFLHIYTCAGVSETVVLNMSTLVWSVVTSVQRGAPLASEVFDDVENLIFDT